MCYSHLVVVFFFFNQNTAYEMRISDWSSDVCSSDLLDIGEIDRIDLGGLGRDVDDGRPAALHEKGRFFDHVMAEVDDAVRRLDRAVDEIARRQCGATEEFGMPLVDHPLAELGGEEGDAGLFDELQQHTAGHRAVGAGADDEERKSKR